MDPIEQLKKHNAVLTEIIRHFLKLDVASLSGDFVDKAVTVTVLPPAEADGLYRAVLGPSPPTTPASASSGGAKRRPAPIRKPAGRRPSPPAKPVSVGLFDEYEEYCDRYDQAEALFSSKSQRYLCIARIGLAQYAAQLQGIVKPKDPILREQFTDWEMRLLGLKGYASVPVSQDDVDMMRKGHLIHLRNKKPELKEGCATPLLQYLPLESVFADHVEAAGVRWGLVRRPGKDVVVRRLGTAGWEVESAWSHNVTELAVVLQDYCTSRFRSLYRVYYGDNVYREGFREVPELKVLAANVVRCCDAGRVEAALKQCLPPVAADAVRLPVGKGAPGVVQSISEVEKRAVLEVLFDDVPRDVELGTLGVL